MADTYTGNLKVRKPQTGSYNNTWGAVLNSDMMELFDQAITGLSTIVVASTAISIPAMTNGSSAPSRFFCMQFIGTPPAAVTATMPGSVGYKFYLIDNQCGQDITFTYGGSGTPPTATVKNGEKRLIWCDGTGCYDVLSESTDSASLGGVLAQYWARVKQDPAEVTAATPVFNDFVGVTNAEPYGTTTEGPTTTIDCNTGNSQILTLTGNRTMATPVNPRDGFGLDLLVVQDSTGGRTLTWGSAFLFEGGLPPILASSPGATDRFFMRYNAALTKWYVAHFAGLAPASGASNLLTISQSTYNWNLLAALGFTPGGSLNCTITVNAGVTIGSVVAGAPAMDLSGLPSGSVVNLINNGYIIGKGGDGADGASVVYPGSGATVLSATDGRPGGNAIVGPGASNTFNITNASGHIWGGGGGGGGGGAQNNLSVIGLANIGGAGGGAGGGKGGRPGRSQLGNSANEIAQDGHDGGVGAAGVGGTAGSNVTSGNFSAGTSASGGNYGTAGTAGTDSSLTNQAHAWFSAGGAAGKAIELLAAAAPTFLSGNGSPNVLGAVS